MIGQPKVSVIIPTYNNERYVLNAVESVLSQTYSNFEVLVIDDGSTDNTRDLFNDSDHRVRLLHQENTGVAAARNRGIREARGEYIAFLDSDDLWLPSNLAIKISILMKDQLIGAVFSEFEIFTDGKTLYEFGSQALYPIFKRDQIAIKDILESKKKIAQQDLVVNYRTGQIFDKLFRGNFILTSTLFVRRSLIDAAGGFNESFGTNEDYELFLRLSRQTEMAYIEESLVRYRRHVGQLTSPENNKRILEAVLNIIDKQEAYFSSADRERKFINRKAQVLLSLGKVCTGIGQPSEARQYLLESIQLCPSNVGAYFHLIMTLLPVKRIMNLLRAIRT